MLTLAFPPGETSPPALTGRLVNSWRNDQDEPFAQAFVDDRRRILAWRGLGTFSFSLDTPIVTVWHEPSAAPDLVQDMFARVIQPVILQAMGWQALHASAVAGPEGAIVFCGVGHSGKSTLAYIAGLGAGITQVADDAVLLDVKDRSVTLHPLPFRPKLRMPSYGHLATTTGRDPHSIATRTEGVSTPLRAIFVLGQDASAPRFPLPEPLMPSRAFRELLRHAHCFDDQDRSHNRALLEAYLTIAETVPVARVTYQPDLSGLDQLSKLVIQAGFRRVGHSPPASDRRLPC